MVYVQMCQTPGLCVCMCQKKIIQIWKLMTISIESFQRLSHSNKMVIINIRKWIEHSGEDFAKNKRKKIQREPNIYGFKWQ